MKKFFNLFLALALMVAPLAYATERDEITPNGVSQLALSAFLYEIYNAGVIQPNGALLANPVLAAGSTAGKAKTTGAISYTVNGTFYTKAATDDLCDTTALTPNLTSTTYTKLIFSIGSAGTCTVTMGTVANSVANSAYGSIPSNEIVLGGLTIGGATHTWASEAVTADNGTFTTPKTIMGELRSKTNIKVSNTD